MRFLFMAVALTGLLFSLESPMTVDAKEPDFDEISGWIERQLDYTGDPGLAVAVVKDGEIVFADGFGWSDKEKRRRANEHTSYSIASISKPITATAIQKLVAAGKLDVDQPANTYLGKAKTKNRFGEDDAVTVGVLEAIVFNQIRQTVFVVVLTFHNGLYQSFQFAEFINIGHRCLLTDGTIQNRHNAVQFIITRATETDITVVIKRRWRRR